MAYTPELQKEHSHTLRRIAWALNMPMTRAMAEIFTWLPKAFDKKIVCARCRDKTLCPGCAFKNPS
jgi:hypothetical protein